jgi:hypothetical protein
MIKHESPLIGGELESSALDNSKHHSNLTLSAQKECEQLDGKDESRDCGSSLPMSCDIIRSLQIRTTRMQRGYQIQRAEFT